MKNILLVICVVSLFMSCHKKKADTAAPVTPKGPWVKANTGIDKGITYIFSLRDTLVLGANITSNQYTMPCFYSGIIKPNYTVFWGHSAPFTEGITSLITYEDALYTTGGIEDVYCSNDLGKSWVQKNKGSVGNSTYSDLLGTDLGLYFCGHEILFSNDKGNNWTDISIPDMAVAYHIVSIQNTLIASVIVRPNSSTVLYKSEDNGLNWEPLNPIGMSGVFINKFASINNVLYASSMNSATNSSVYISTDKGAHWIKSIGLDVLGPNTFNAFDSYNGVVYVASYRGVFKSVDNGRNWSFAGCNNVVSLTINNNTLYAVTQSDGIWTAPLTSL